MEVNTTHEKCFKNCKAQCKHIIKYGLGTGSWEGCEHNWLKINCSCHKRPSDNQSVLAGPSGSRLPTALQTLPQEPDSAPLNPALLSLPTWAQCVLGWPASIPKGTSPSVWSHLNTQLPLFLTPRRLFWSKAQQAQEKLQYNCGSAQASGGFAKNGQASPGCPGGATHPG